MSVIVSIFGANASGKTSLVRGVIAAAKKVRPLQVDGSGKESGYQLTRTDGSHLHILGRYKDGVASGGLDMFSFKGAAEDITVWLNELAEQGDVLCEGILHMSSWGHQRLVDFYQYHENHGNHVIFGMLNPPWEVVLQRLAKRQSESTRARTTPFDPEKTIRGKHDGIPRSIAKLAAAGCDTREVPWDNPVPTVLKWLRVS